MENRTQNIRVRITEEERKAVEKAAAASGFTGNLSDYIRFKLGLK